MANLVFSQMVRATAGGLLLGLTLTLLTASGCGRVGGPLPQVVAATTETHTSVDEAQDLAVAEPTVAADSDDLVVRIDRLRQRGRFEEFVDAALNADESHDPAAIAVLKAEAHLSVGQPQAAEAAARAAIRRALKANDPNLTDQSLRLWAIARFRQQKSLDDQQLSVPLSQFPASDGQVRMLRFWLDALAGAGPYQLEASQEPVELKMAAVEPGSVAAELNAIQARVNGRLLSPVFIDTGAQQTVMTVAAAEAAGVKFGPSVTRLVGFRGTSARPGILESLELGDLVLHQVPVLVGDSAPLVALDGQMSLGTELMQHVRFTIDFPLRRVWAEPSAGSRTFRQPAAQWQIPVWTFSHACLARGETASRAPARVLVDTGNRSGTFLSRRWAPRSMPKLQGSPASLVFRYQHHNLSLDELALGNLVLEDWPVADILPHDLERLGLVDVLVGRDLLSPYRLTIDLARRVFELHQSVPQGSDVESEGN